MSIVYITDQGSSLYKKGDRLYVKKGKHILRWILAKDIEQLILLGNIAISAQCVTYLLKYKIDTVFLTYYGKYKGRLVGEFGKNVRLRLDQFDFINQENKRNQIAKEFIKAKLKNCLFLVQNRQYRLKKDELATFIMQTKAILNYRIDQTNDLEILRGYEGITAKNYFSIFPVLITNTDFIFKGRNRRPPKDEVNALLSLGYTLLLSHFLGKVYTAGLDPYYGALHSVDYGRQSLVLDLMEEFRPLVDDLIIGLINKRDIRKEHFQYNILEDQELDEPFPEQTVFLPVCMSKEGMKKFIYSFTTMLNKKFYYSQLNAMLSINQIIMSQIRLLAAQFKNEKNYQGFILNKNNKYAKILPD